MQICCSLCSERGWIFEHIQPDATACVSGASVCSMRLHYIIVEYSHSKCVYLAYMLSFIKRAFEEILIGRFWATQHTTPHYYSQWKRTVLSDSTSPTSTHFGIRGQILHTLGLVTHSCRCRESGLRWKKCVRGGFCFRPSLFHKKMLLAFCLRNDGAHCFSVTWSMRVTCIDNLVWEKPGEKKQRKDRSCNTDEDHSKELHKAIA